MRTIRRLVTCSEVTQTRARAWAGEIKKTAKECTYSQAPAALPPQLQPDLPDIRSSAAWPHSPTLCYSFL